MSTATKDDQVDEARDALVSDVQQLKAAGREVIAEAEAKLPWVVGGAAGLFIAGMAVRAATRPRPLFEVRRPSLLGKAIRAAALAGIGILTRRYVTHLVNQALPEPNSSTPTSGSVEQ